MSVKLYARRRTRKSFGDRVAPSGWHYTARRRMIGAHRSSSDP
jgi:hypothetical protein